MKKMLLGSFFGFGLLLSGCIPAGTRAFHVPHLDEKGDFQAMGTISPMNGLEVQADYAWGDKFYSPADFSWSRISSGNQTQRSNAYSIGIGYYHKMQKAGRFNVYFIPTYGNYGNTTGSAVQTKYFAQNLGADIGYRFKYFESAFSTKLSTYQYFKAGGGNQTISATNWDTGLTVRYGGRKWKWHMQMGLSYPLTNDDFLNYILNAGLHYRINFLNKSKINERI